MLSLSLSKYVIIYTIDVMPPTLLSWSSWDGQIIWKQKGNKDNWAWYRPAEYYLHWVRWSCISLVGWVFLVALHGIYLHRHFHSPPSCPPYVQPTIVPTSSSLWQQATIFVLYNGNDTFFHIYVDLNTHISNDEITTAPFKKQMGNSWGQLVHCCADLGYSFYLWLVRLVISCPILRL